MRRIQTFTAADGRDAGKTFQLTEMAAESAEWWAIRAARALAIGGINLPENWENAGMATLAMVGFAALGHLPEFTLKELLAEMFACVKFQPTNTKIPPQDLIPGDGSQIEEVATRWKIRQALWYLHTGFSEPGEVPTTV